jgi:hypothetical protein
MQNAQSVQAAFSAPQAFASQDSSVQLKNAHAESVWLVSHHQPAGEAAYSREAYVGQHSAFLKGGGKGQSLFPIAAWGLHPAVARPAPCRPRLISNRPATGRQVSKWFMFSTF